MTMTDLETKWPRAQFEEFKAKGHFHPDDIYEEYLEMRREQEEIAEEGRLLGLTGDDPPELTEEDEAILDQIWAELGREAELKRKMELEAKWPRTQFEEFKAKGHFHTIGTYEEYLDMRRKQEEIADELPEFVVEERAA